jgi:hypothetical protein
MILGITGHQRLNNPKDWEWVREELERAVNGLSGPWVGLSSLAMGADQLFAAIVLKSGGRLKVILPNERYKESFAPGPERERYLELLKQASQVTLLTAAASDEESYLEAGKTIVDQSDRLVAIWDGQAAKGLGGTGDIVAYAFASGKKVIHINPVSRRVEQK